MGAIGEMRQVLCLFVIHIVATQAMQQAPPQGQEMPAKAEAAPPAPPPAPVVSPPAEPIPTENPQAQAAEQAGDTAGKAMVQDGESALKKVEEVINNVDKVLKQQQEKSESPMTW